MAASPLDMGLSWSAPDVDVTDGFGSGFAGE